MRTVVAWFLPTARSQGAHVSPLGARENAPRRATTAAEAAIHCYSESHCRGSKSRSSPSVTGASRHLVASVAKKVRYTWGCILKAVSDLCAVFLLFMRQVSLAGLIATLIFRTLSVWEFVFSFFASRLNRLLVVFGIGLGCFMLLEHWRHSWRMAQLRVGLYLVINV